MSAADIRALVARGYDRVADRYEALEPVDREWPRLRWLDRLLEGVPAGERVLDVGCGNGLPATRRIAERFSAVGVDVSAEQLDRARRNVPEAEFVHADVLSAEFDQPFAAIAAFYVIEHLPRERHAAVFERWHRWLGPRGRLLFTIEPYDEPGQIGNWLGEPMFFSQYDPQTTLGLLERAGFTVIESSVETQLEGDHDVDYLWVLAERRPTAA
jgi:cyclopropane fatty-acyl-phospholipid synthase-like methyltransferase